MRILAALLVLAAACKTDEQPKPAPAPPPAPAKLEVAPGPKPVPAPAEPTKSQQSLEKRSVAFTKIAITAKKNQRDCTKLASHVPALVEELRAISVLRADLERDDADTDLATSNLVLKEWLAVADECKDFSKFEPVMNALIDAGKR
jgi:hypothetical protein